MFYDLLVHVDLPDESRFVMALGNINNYLAALNGEPCTPSPRKTCSPASKSCPPASWKSSASNAKTSPTSSRDHQNSRGLVVLKALSPPPKPSAEGFLFMKAT